MEISKEKQIEEMAKVMCGYYGTEKCYDCRYCCDCHIKHEADRLYKAGYRKQSDGEWISVEERLPDVCGMPVLMVAENEYGQTNVVKGFTDYTCPVVFHTNEMEYYGIWRAWKVTHWMPLPEPPVTKGV